MKSLGNVAAVIVGGLVSATGAGLYQSHRIETKVQKGLYHAQFSGPKHCAVLCKDPISAEMVPIRFKPWDRIRLFYDVEPNRSPYVAWKEDNFTGPEEVEIHSSVADASKPKDAVDRIIHGKYD